MIKWIIRTAIIILCPIAALAILTAPLSAPTMDLCLSFNIMLGFLMCLFPFLRRRPWRSALCRWRCLP